MNRLEARKFLMESLFQMELNKEFNKENIPVFLERQDCKDQEEYVKDVLNYVCDNFEAIDEKINKHSHKWKTSRMPKIDLTILRLAIAENQLPEEIPKAVIINEAVNLAKKYSGEGSPKFINGVLGNVLNG